MSTFWKQCCTNNFIFKWTFSDEDITSAIIRFTNTSSNNNSYNDTETNNTNIIQETAPYHVDTEADSFSMEEVNDSFNEQIDEDDNIISGRKRKSGKLS